MSYRAKQSPIHSGLSESFLDVLLRVNATQKSLAVCHTDNRIDKILDKFGLYCIDFSVNNAPAINRYIYKLIIEATKESKENNKQLQALTQCKSKHKIIIFDGLNCFNIAKFKSFLSEDTTLESIAMVHEPDPFSLLISIYRYFMEQAALNINLKLVIIYCDDSFISDLMEFLIQRKLSLYVVLISYSVSTVYSRGLYNGEVQGIEFLTIDSTSESINVKKTFKGKVKCIASFNNLQPKN
uniref:Uncharacterized protein n=1 Tax=Tetranychus urticae TaxID=32264 RepID=T1KIF9_TETUR